MSPVKQRGLWFHLLDVVFNIVVIVAIVAGIRTFLVSPFQVEGSSMASTLEDNEYIVINKLAYYIGEPERGDIVVFRPPTSDHKKFYVKRVIGVPDDTVVLRDGFVYLRAGGEGELVKLDEEYLDERNSGKTFAHPPGSGETQPIEYEVPDGHYFLLGDNRLGSLDSRSFIAADAQPAPFVSQEDIKGRVWFVALPITKIHAFEPPDYNL